jgi:hypothetical protein
MKKCILFLMLLISVFMSIRSAHDLFWKPGESATATGRRFFKGGDPSDGIRRVFPGGGAAMDQAVVESRYRGENERIDFQWKLFRFLMWLVLLIVPASLVSLTIRVMRLESRRAYSPIEILKARYAWGGISREEYARIKRELET